MADEQPQGAPNGEDKGGPLNLDQAVEALNADPTIHETRPTPTRPGQGRPRDENGRFLPEAAAEGEETDEEPAEAGTDTPEGDEPPEPSDEDVEPSEGEEPEGEPEEQDEAPEEFV